MSHNPRKKERLNFRKILKVVTELCTFDHKVKMFDLIIRKKLKPRKKGSSVIN